MIPLFPQNGGFVNADGALVKKETLLEGTTVPGEPLDAAFGGAKVV